MFAATIRDVVRDIVGVESEIDDVVGTLWLQNVEDDKRSLRAFTPSRNASLLNWLTIQLPHLAHEHRRKLKRHRKRTVPFDEKAAKCLRTDGVGALAGDRRQPRS